MGTSEDPIPVEDQSFVDGVMKVTIRDGMGRIVEELDNLGGSAGAGFTAMQTTSTKTYDDRGMLSGSTVSIGATDPLVYETQITLDAKLRPQLVCGRDRGRISSFTTTSTSRP